MYVCMCARVCHRAAWFSSAPGWDWRALEQGSVDPPQRFAVDTSHDDLLVPPPLSTDALQVRATQWCSPVLLWWAASALTLISFAAERRPA
eukprot:COSAG01_NODE_3951_length_5501_cov_3.287116_7_plen_91_part_00